MCTKMREVVKEKWLNALESGKYRQTRGKLRGKFGFCCLGVLCDVHRKTMKKSEYSWDHDMYLGNASNLPENLNKWANLDQEAESKLITMNDGSKKNFKAIAAWIRKNL